MSIGKSGQGELDILDGGTVVVTVGGISVGQSLDGVGTLFVEAGGTLEDSGGGITVGNSSGAFGFADINGGLVEDTTNGLTVGNAGAGTLDVNAGTVSLFGGITVGNSATGVGLVDMTGGVLTSGTGGMSVGNLAGAMGTLDLSAGTIALQTYLTVGGANGGTGFVDITGGAITSSAGGLTVSNFGAGTVDMSAGTIALDTYITVGQSAGANGLIDMTGGSLTSSTGGLNVGLSGAGTLELSNGTVAVASGIGIGQAVGGSGFVTIANGLLSGGNLSVGNSGAGTLEVGAGGTVSAGTGFAIGSSGTGRGTVVVNDGTLHDGGVFTVGAGTLLVEGGGLVIGNGASTLQIEDGSTATVNGGTLGGFGNVVVGVLGVDSPGTLVVTGGGTLEGAVVSVENGGLLQAGSLTIGGAITDGEIGNLSIETGGTVVVSTITLTTGGVIDLNGGVLDPITMDVTGAGMIGGSGTLDANVSFAASGDSLTYSDPGGTLEIVGSVSGAGTLVLATSSSILLDVAPDGAQAVTFGPGTETLILGAPAINTTAFTAMSVGLNDLIDFGGTTTVSSISYAPGTDGQNVTLDVTQSGTTGTITIDNVLFTNDATKFNITTDSTTGDSAIEAAPCFAAGTRIATARGEIAVEDLFVGDLVTTVLGECEAPIIWIGRREVDCAHRPKPRQVWPVRVTAGAFGPGRPHTDLVLSPDHAVYVGDVLIPVRHLINGSTIVQVPVERVTYYHLELAEHDVVLAEGMPAESYLDMRDGSNYANRPGPVRLYTDHAARMWEAFGCARLIVTGPELTAARALVASFAAEQAAA
jgi:collagen type I/II/III/V/XI/XXIV/XXVII alpha